MNICYIVCPGHSGSTLLDMLLGMHKDIFSTGELVHLPNQYNRTKFLEPSPKNGVICSCGRSFYECNFWGEIRNRLNRELNYNIYNNPLKFKTAFLMRHEIPHLRLPQRLKRRFIHLIIKNQLTYIDKLLKSNAKGRISNNELLYKYISQLSGAKYITDSSKDMYRLHYLLHSKINIKVIVLKRNVFGVAASSKKLKMSPFNAAKNWYRYYNNLNAIFKYHHIKPVDVSYENLVNNSIVELNRVYKNIGLSELDNFDGTFDTNKYHIVAGNGLRFRGAVKIREDKSWETVLTSDEINGIKDLIKKLRIYD